MVFNWYDDLATWVSKLILTNGVRWVIKIFTGLGIGYVSYAMVLQPLLDLAIGKWQSMPGSVAQWLGALGIDVALSIIISAYGFKGAERLLLTRTNRP